MDELNNLTAEIIGFLEEFKMEHTKFSEKGNKSAGRRARKALSEVKKRVTEYRKASMSYSETL